MAEVWKVEYHVIGPDGEARDWLETYNEALQIFACEDLRIDKVTYYYNKTETVLEAGVKHHGIYNG